jgi:hypothetical protein
LPFDQRGDKSVLPCEDCKESIGVGVDDAGEVYVALAHNDRVVRLASAS